MPYKESSYTGLKAKNMNLGIYLLFKFLIENELHQKFINDFNIYHNRNISSLRELKTYYDQKTDISEIIIDSGFSSYLVSFVWSKSVYGNSFWCPYSISFAMYKEKFFQKYFIPIKLKKVSVCDFLFSVLEELKFTEEVLNVFGYQNNIKDLSLHQAKKMFDALGNYKILKCVLVSGLKSLIWSRSQANQKKWTEIDYLVQKEFQKKFLNL